MLTRNWLKYWKIPYSSRSFDRSNAVKTGQMQSWVCKYAVFIDFRFTFRSCSVIVLCKWLTDRGIVGVFQGCNRSVVGPISPMILLLHSFNILMKMPAKLKHEQNNTWTSHAFLGGRYRYSSCLTPTPHQCSTCELSSIVTMQVTS